jgi:predicted outer membrane repeat protein
MWFFSPLAANPLVSRQVSSTADLKAAMGDGSVSDIVMSGGVYHLADEAGLGCSLFQTPFFLCITRNLRIRAAAGATVVLEGGKKGGVACIGGAGPPFVSVIASLEGLEITNGSVTDSPWGYVIVNMGGSTLTITSTSVHDNIGWGSAIYNDGGAGSTDPPSTLTITNSEVFMNNGTMNSGGGIYSAGILTITNSSIHHNSCDGGAGGGITNADGNLTVIDSEVNNNYAGVDGGGIFNSGIYMNSVSADIISSNIHHNFARVNGGGISHSAGAHHSTTLSIAKSQINFNTATAYGGGIWASNDSSCVANLTITDSEFLYNNILSTHGDGGGIINAGEHQLQTVNTTVCFNVPDDCVVNSMSIYPYPPCKVPLNPCPSSTYVCGPDYQCEAVPPGAPLGPYHNLTLCEAACHP